MMALDTNVLVRFLVEDDAVQAERAKALLQRAIDSDAPCYVSDVVLCELVWVLERRYAGNARKLSQCNGQKVSHPQPGG